MWIILPIKNMDQAKQRLAEKRAQKVNIHLHIATSASSQLLAN